LDARAAGDRFILVYLADAQPLIIEIGLDGGSPRTVEVAGGGVAILRRSSAFRRSPRLRTAIWSTPVLPP
jgi:hypothetical protein